MQPRRALCRPGPRAPLTLALLHPEPPSLQAEAALRAADGWEFDAFELDAATDGRPLSTLGAHLLHIAMLNELDANSSAPFHDNAQDMGLGFHRQVAAIEDRPEIGT